MNESDDDIKEDFREQLRNVKDIIAEATNQLKVLPDIIQD
jgi:hypothetical protein